MIDKLINTAKYELNYREDKNEGTKYGTWYGLPNQPWCAMFISWCCNKANIPLNVIPKFASCSYAVKWFYQNKRFYLKNNYRPKTGDLVFFTDGELTDKYYSSHVGIVEFVDNKLHTIEGNSPNGVYQRTYDLNDIFIKGYANPRYIENNQSNLKYKIGDKVKFKKLFISSVSTKPLTPLIYEGIITKIYEERKNPYLIDNNVGFVNDNVIINKYYIVKKGDTLSKIGYKYNTEWQKIYENNKNVIGDNPDLIKPGQKLVI